MQAAQWKTTETFSIINCRSVVDSPSSGLVISPSSETIFFLSTFIWSEIKVKGGDSRSEANLL